MSDAGNSLVNIKISGDITKPASILIKKVSAAVGVLYEPVHMKRMAHAEAEARKVRALSELELNEIEQRSINRFIGQEVRKQIIIEEITSQAAKALTDDAKVECLEEDWLAHFFKQCDYVSDKGMQSLWARILSGEASNPGAFSKRTVDFAATLDKRDAELFTAFGQHVWMLGSPSPLIFDINDDIYKTNGISFDTLKHLDAIGLISFEPLGGYVIERCGKYLHAFYYGRPVILEFDKDEDNSIDVGRVLLTSIGKELIGICGSSSSNEFYEYVIQKWFDRGLVLVSPVPRQ